MGRRTESRTPSPYARAALIVAVVVVVGVIASVVLTRPRSGAEGPRQESTDASTLERSSVTNAPQWGGPSSEPGGVPVGFTSDESGAAGAAVAYATASQRWLYFSDDQIRDAVGEIATTAAAPRLTEEVVSDVSMARQQLSASTGPVWWLVRPLAWRIDAFDTAGARVSVWTITLLSAAGVASPQSEYVTVVLVLVWVDGGWRVDAVRDQPGPTPVSGPKDQPWDAEAFDDMLDGFTRMDGEAVT